MKNKFRNDKFISVLMIVLGIVLILCQVFTFFPKSMDWNYDEGIYSILKFMGTWIFSIAGALCLLWGICSFKKKKLIRGAKIVLTIAFGVTSIVVTTLSSYLGFSIGQKQYSLYVMGIHNIIAVFAILICGPLSMIFVALAYPFSYYADMNFIIFYYDKETLPYFIFAMIGTFVVPCIWGFVTSGFSKKGTGKRFALGMLIGYFDSRVIDTCFSILRFSSHESSITTTVEWTKVNESIILLFCATLFTIVPLLLLIRYDKKHSIYDAEVGKKTVNNNDRPSNKRAKVNTADVIMTDFLKMTQSALERLKHDGPVLFAAQKPNSEDYGYSVENPICTSSMAGTEQYLRRLCTKSGQRFTWTAPTSIRSDCHGITDIGIDRYTLLLDSVKFNDLYIIPFVGQSEFPPYGLFFVDNIKDLSEEREAFEWGVPIDLYRGIREAEVAATAKREKEAQDHQHWLSYNTKRIMEIYPTFNLQNEMSNPTFTKLMDIEFDIVESYEYAHRSELFERVPTENMTKTYDFSKYTANYFYSILETIEYDNLIEPSPLTPQQLREKAHEMGIDSLETVQRLIEQEHKAIKESIGEKKRYLIEIASQVPKLKQKYPEFDLQYEYNKGTMFKTLYPLLSLVEAYELTYFKRLFRKKVE